MALRPVVIEVEGGSCPTCGAAMEDGAEFCTDCGARVKPNNCAKCDAALPAGAKFCRGCGTKKDEPKPQAVAAKEDGAPGAQVVPGQVVTSSGGFWTERKVDWCIDRVDELMAMAGEEPTEDWEREMLVKDAIPVLNKRFPFDSVDDDEARLWMSVAMVFGPRALAAVLRWWRATGAQPPQLQAKTTDDKGGGAV